MRADARSLLDRLGRSDFAYKEFADRFSDLELWPLFEALLKDPRLFQQEAEAQGVSGNEPVTAPGIAAARPVEAASSAFAASARASAAPPPAPPHQSPAPAVAPAPAPASAPTGTESLAELFSRYEAGGDAAPRTRQQQDVRAMLRRLSDLDSQGKL